MNQKYKKFSDLVPDDRGSSISIIIGLSVSIFFIIRTGINYYNTSILELGNSSVRYVNSVLYYLQQPRMFQQYKIAFLVILGIVLLVNLPYFIKAISIYQHAKQLDESYSIRHLRENKKPLPSQINLEKKHTNEKTGKSTQFEQQKILNYSSYYTDNELFDITGFHNIELKLMAKRKNLKTEMKNLEKAIDDIHNQMTLASLHGETLIMDSIDFHITLLRTHEENLSIVHQELYREEMEPIDQSMDLARSNVVTLFTKFHEIDTNLNMIRHLDIGTVWAFSKLSEQMILEKNSFEFTLQHLLPTDVGQYIDTENRVIRIERELVIPGIGKFRHCYDTAKNAKRFCHCGRAIPENLLEYAN